MSFKLKEQDVAILKSFSTLNSSMIINPEKFSVVNSSKSCVAFYIPEEKYDFQEFGIYEMTDFLAALGTLKNPEITDEEKYLVISSNGQKFKYFTTAKDLIQPAKINIEKIDAVEFGLEFDLSAEKFSMLMKSANIVRASNVFFETSKKKILITVAEELASSNNSFEIPIEEGITKNDLKEPVAIPISDMRLLPGDYTVKISNKISKWTHQGCNLNYYIGVNKAK